MPPISPELFAGLMGAAFIIQVAVSVYVGRLPTRSFAMAFPLVMIGLTAPMYFAVAINYYLK